MDECMPLNSAIKQTFAVLEHVAAELRGANPAWTNARTVAALEHVVAELRSAYWQYMNEPYARATCPILALITQTEIGKTATFPLVEIRLATRSQPLLGYVQQVGARWVAETHNGDIYSYHNTRDAAVSAVALRAGGIGQ